MSVQTNAPYSGLSVRGYMFGEIFCNYFLCYGRFSPLLLWINGAKADLRVEDKPWRCENIRRNVGIQLQKILCFIQPCPEDVNMLQKHL